MDPDQAESPLTHQAPSLLPDPQRLPAPDATLWFCSTKHISFLPSEVLVKIFLTLDAWRRSVVDSNIIPDRWAVAHTCKDWRTLVSSTPELWQGAVLDLTPKHNIVGGGLYEWGYNRLQKQFQWSGGRPLTIALHIGTLDPTGENIDWWRSSHSWGIHALRMILSQSSRISRLWLHCQPHAFPLITDRCGVQVPSYFPHLNMLGLSSLPPSFHANTAPNLKTVLFISPFGQAEYYAPRAQALQPLQPSQHYWSNLRRFALVNFSWPAYSLLHTLGISGTLEELALYLKANPELIQPKEHSLPLSQLKLLEVFSSHPLTPETNGLAVTRSFLRSLFLPRLERLRCTHGVARGTLVILLDLARKSGWSRTLTSLHIAPRLLTSRSSRELFSDLLRELTSLETLELSLAQKVDSGSPISKFEAKEDMVRWLCLLLLERRGPGRTGTLPRLQHLHVLNINRNIVCDSLFCYAIESRTYVHVNKPGTPFLRTLVLKYDGTETEPDHGMLAWRNKGLFDVFIYEAQAQSGPLVDHIRKGYDEPLEADLEGPGALQDIHASAYFEALEREVWVPGSPVCLYAGP